VIQVFDSKRAELVPQSMPEAWRDARQAAVIVYQSCAMRIPGKGPAYRDEMMAANVDWLAAQALPGEKMVIWSDNGHVRPGGGSMGTWLRQRYGRQMYVTGFAFRRGQVRAAGLAGGKFTGLGDSDVPASPEGSGDAILGATGLPVFFLDLASVSPDGPLGRWLAQPTCSTTPGPIGSPTIPSPTWRRPCRRACMTA